MWNFLLRSQADSLYAALGHDHAGAYEPLGEAAAMLDAHLVDGDPHPQYTAVPETDPVFTTHSASGVTSQLIDQWSAAYGWGNHAGLYAIAGHNHAGLYDAAGTAASAVAAHEVAADPHPGYLTESEADVLYAVAGHDHSGLYAAVDHTHAALLANVVDDATPQLGGSLDANGHGIHFEASESIEAPTGETATIDLGAGNHHTLDCSGGSLDAIALTLTVPTGPTAGTIIVVQGAYARWITWTPSVGSVKWLGAEPTWTDDAGKYRIVSWRWNGAFLFLSATDTD